MLVHVPYPHQTDLLRMVDVEESEFYKILCSNYELHGSTYLNETK